jgi:hypothetical protein
MECTQHIPRMEHMRNPSIEIRKGTNNTGELLANVRKILKLIIKKWGWRVSSRFERFRTESSGGLSSARK